MASVLGIDKFDISIHALLRGRTSPARALRRWCIFQFTPSCEGEPKEPDRFTVELISIHALLRGRTSRRNTPRSSGTYFNSRPLARANVRPLHAAGRMGDFNSRPLARANLPAHKRWYSMHYFNSRPLARANSLALRSFLRRTISIHALLRGRTGGPQ